MNKRAQEILGMPLWEVMGMILIVLLLVGLLIFLFRVVGAGGENETRATLNGFVTLTTIVLDYVADERPFLPVPLRAERENVPTVTFQQHPLYLDDEFIIVGFNKGAEAGAQPADGCDAWSGDFREKAIEHIPRPTLCPPDTACLCLYPQTVGGDDFDADDKPQSCATFDTVDYILSFWYTDSEGANEAPFVHPELPATETTRDVFFGACYPWTPQEYLKVYEGLPIVIQFTSGVTCAGQPPNPRNPYASFVLYGQCGAEKEHRQRTVYIEKAIVKGKTYIIISAPIDSRLVERRQNAVETEAFKDAYTAAKAAYDAKKYKDAVLLLTTFISIAKDRPALANLVSEAQKLLADAQAKAEAPKA